MKCGCIGEKLGHSFSKQIHEALGLYDYELWPLTKEELDGFLRRRAFHGINVTIPYKKEVIPYLEEISEEALLCGAVNTVVHREGKLYGYNTDFLGMKRMLERANISLSGKKVLILGSGGTSGTALALCRHEGADAVRVSRREQEGFLTYAQAAKERDIQMILNTTPCGMYPHMGEIPLSPKFFPHLEAVADVIYNPLKSQLVLEGEKRGIPSVGGLYMLVAQALIAAEIFTGKTVCRSRAEEIYQSLLREKTNLVLIGMPGSGKTTLGKALARRCGRLFADSDEEIVRQAGKSIPQIFAEEGEEGFRDRESLILRELAQRQGLIIATGGGAVLREENVDLLRGNGILFFLDAPLEQLEATSDRPLSSDIHALRRRYEERYSLYCKVANKRIPVSRDVEENILAIEKEWK